VLHSYTPVKKNKAELTWGANQQHAFEDIKRYLSSLSVMKAPMTGIPFWLYIAGEGKKHIITYLSQCLINSETRYSLIEKLCLSLFYACSKLRYYLLPSTCVVACQADVIKYMLQWIWLMNH
jgi:hypothetical protein